MYGGHIPADPNNTAVASGAVTAQLYFFMVNNRKTADKDRIIFWFNVCPRHIHTYRLLKRIVGRSGMFFI